MRESRPGRSSSSSLVSPSRSNRSYDGRSRASSDVSSDSSSASASSMLISLPEKAATVQSHYECRWRVRSTFWPGVPPLDSSARS